MVLARDSWNGRGLEGELMNKKDEWITRAVHVLRNDGHMDDYELHRLLEEAKNIK